VIVYAIHDLRSSPDHPLGDAVETFVRREDAERFVEEVRGDDPDLKRATYLYGASDFHVARRRVTSSEVQSPR